MSPKSGRSPIAPAAGNDNTFVAASTPRQSRLSWRIDKSSVRTIASSALGVDSRAAASAIAPASDWHRLAVSRARLDGMSIFGVFLGAPWPRSCALSSAFFEHVCDLPDVSLDASLTLSGSLLGRRPGLRAAGGISPLALRRCGLVVGLDDARDQRMADDVVGREA